MARGALRSRRASSKATGVPRSPRLAVRRVFERDCRQRGVVEGVERLQHARDVRAHAVMNRKNHADMHVHATMWSA